MWNNSIVRAVLMGTHDVGSPLNKLESQNDLLHYIFSFWAEVLVCLGGVRGTSCQQYAISLPESSVKQWSVSVREC